ncbi:MAG: hypothetical protein Fur0014_02890 [Rubrivivax sp.]
MNLIDSQTAARLRPIGLTPAMRLHLEAQEPVPEAPFLCRVTAVQRDALTLHDGEAEHPARALPLSQLARRQHDGREKATRAVVVSNVDTALLVMGLDQDFNLRRLERYLALVRLSRLDAVVVLTKADLCEPRFAERRRRTPARSAPATAAGATPPPPAACTACPAAPA